MSTNARYGSGAVLTVSQVAKEFGVTPSTIRRWIEEGHIDAAQPAGEGGLYRIAAAEVDRVWNRLKRLPAGEDLT